MMQMEETITKTKGDDEGRIDALIDFLQKAKQKGARRYRMTWDSAPHGAFRWFETYRIKSEEEIKQEKIAWLERELNYLKSK